MGGAMDLVGSQGRVVVLTTHTAKNNEPKIVTQCNLPLTGYRAVDMIITDKCVFKVDKEQGLKLIEIADGVKIADLLKITGCDFTIAPDLKPMQQA
jgi:3-oxoacid CoA-transferase